MIKVTFGNNISRKTSLVSENTTLRAAIESSGLDFSRGVTSVNGFSVSVADMDSTFTELGVENECFVMNIVKADNAVSVQLVGDQMVVVTTHTPEEWKTACEEADMTLYKDEKKTDPYFAVGYSEGSRGGLNEYGLTLSELTNGDGNAIVIVQLPENLETEEDKKKYVVKHTARKLKAIEELEAKVQPAIDGAKAFYEEVATKISVI